MSRNIWIGVVVVIVIAAGAWWYFNKSNAPATTQAPIEQTTQTQQQTNSQLTQTASGDTSPSATIDQSSLTSDSAHPTITGSAQGLTSVTVAVSQISSDQNQHPVWSATVPVHGGKWSFTPMDSNAMIGGGDLSSAHSYKVLVFAPNDNGQHPLISGILELTSAGLSTYTNVQYGFSIPSSKMTATPTSGAAPLTVTFSNFTAGCDQISFGDPPNPDAPEASASYGSWPAQGITHTYTSAGIFTAELNCDPNAPSTVTIAVTGGPSAGPSATIDSNTLIQNAGTINLSGTATNANTVQVSISVPGIAGEGYGNAVIASVIDGKWSATFKDVPAGSYMATVWNAPQASAAPTLQLSRSSTLTVY